MHTRGPRHRHRQRFERSTSIFLAAASFLVLACGGVTANGPGTGEIDAADNGDAGDKSDAADKSDASGESDAGRPECDVSVVTCKSLPPTCPKGEVPVTAGACWAGYCVKPSTCRTVKDCGTCNADSDVCATDVARANPSVRCVELPKVCANDRTCKCLASLVCSVRPFDACGEIGNGREFQCSCAVCYGNPAGGPIAGF